MAIQTLTRDSLYIYIAGIVTNDYTTCTMHTYVLYTHSHMAHIHAQRLIQAGVGGNYSFGYTYYYASLICHQLLNIVSTYMSCMYYVWVCGAGPEIL